MCGYVRKVMYVLICMFLFFFSFTLSNDTSGAYITSWLYSIVTLGTS